MFLNVVVESVNLHSRDSQDPPSPNKQNDVDETKLRLISSCGSRELYLGHMSKKSVPRGPRLRDSETTFWLFLKVSGSPGVARCSSHWSSATAFSVSTVYTHFECSVTYCDSNQMVILPRDVLDLVGSCPMSPTDSTSRAHHPPSCNLWSSLVFFSFR